MASLLRKKSTNGLKSGTNTPPFRGMQNDAAHPLPHKQRKRQLNRESMDLDEIMAGSDDDGETENIQPLPTPLPRQNKHSRTAVSASARELLDFLDAGPPDDLAPPSKASRDLVEFLATAPPPSTNSRTHSPITKKSSSGRLQRMMSKFSISTTERQRSQSISQADDAGFKFQGTVRRIISKPSLGSLTPKPTPPRPPVIPISPPDSPLHDGSMSAPPSRKPSRTSPWEEPPMPDSATLKTPSEHSSIGSRKRSIRNIFPTGKPSISGSSTHTRSPSGFEEAQITRVQRVPVPYVKAGLTDISHLRIERKDSVPVVVQPVPSPLVIKPPSHVPVSDVELQDVMPAETEKPCIGAEDVYAMRKLIANATNADECRLILDMFMARSGISRQDDVSSPIGTPLERSVVECLLDREEEDGESDGEDLDFASALERSQVI